MSKELDKPREPKSAAEIGREPGTEQAFLLVPERPGDIVAAWVSLAYSLVVIVYAVRLVLDVWTGTYINWFMSSYENKAIFAASPVLKLVVYTAVGGAVGAAMSNIRSFVYWHAERKAFGWRFLGKSFSLPPLGATLAVIVYAVVRGGIAAVGGGDFAQGDPTPLTSFTAFAIGSMSGYGSHKVFIWLDDKVAAFFTVAPVQVKVPDVSGKSVEEATQILTDGKLAPGVASQEPTADAAMIGKVISQSPLAGLEVAKDCKVSLVVGVAAVKVPDVSGKTKDEAAQALQDSKLQLGDITEEATADAGIIGKVIRQIPVEGTTVGTNSIVAVTIGVASPVPEAKVPDVVGKTKDEASEVLQASKLELGVLTEAPAADATMIGKVIEQAPAAGASAASNSKVDVTIGVTSPVPEAKVPDVVGKTKDEASQVLQASKLELGVLTEAPAADATMIGKVIEQAPAAGASAASNSKVDVTIGTKPDGLAD